jgi:hypothetical protein
MIPAPILARVEHAHLFCGCDPVAAGVTGYETGDDGRSYRVTPHVVYGRRDTTIVFPQLYRYGSPWNVMTFIHEYGHVLDEALGFEYDLAPVSEYAQRDRREAFAESFSWWVVGQVWDHDAFSLDLWERLSGQGIPAEWHG